MERDIHPAYDPDLADLDIVSKSELQEAKQAVGVSDEMSMVERSYIKALKFHDKSLSDQFKFRLRELYSKKIRELKQSTEKAPTKSERESRLGLAELERKLLDLEGKTSIEGRPMNLGRGFLYYISEASPAKKPVGDEKAIDGIIVLDMFVSSTGDEINDTYLISRMDATGSNRAFVIPLYNNWKVDETIVLAGRRLNAEAMTNQELNFKGMSKILSKRMLDEETPADEKIAFFHMWEDFLHRSQYMLRKSIGEIGYERTYIPAQPRKIQAETYKEDGASNEQIKFYHEVMLPVLRDMIPAEGLYDEHYFESWLNMVYAETHVSAGLSDSGDSWDIFPSWHKFYDHFIQ